MDLSHLIQNGIKTIRYDLLPSCVLQSLHKAIAPSEDLLFDMETINFNVQCQGFTEIKAFNLRSSITVVC